MWNIINTVIDVPSKTKDSVNAKLDMEELCATNELHFRIRENDNS